MIQSLKIGTTDIRTIAITGHRITHKKGQDCGSNITQGTGLLAILVLSKGILLGVAGHDERDRVGGMRSVGVSSLLVNHLFGVTVVGGDEQEVSGLLASFVDCADGLIGSRDGLDRRI